MSIFKRRRLSGGQTLVARAVQRVFSNAEVGGVYLPYNPDSLMQRRNILPWSEDFTNAAWSLIGLATPARSASNVPGILYSSKLTETTASSQHEISQVAIPSVPGTQYTQFYIVKAAERTVVSLHYGWAGVSLFRGAIVNLSNGASQATVPIGPGGAISTFGAIPLDDGAYLVWAQDTAPVGSTTLNIELKIRTAYTTNNDESYVGDASKGVFVYAAHLQRSLIVPTLADYQKVTDWYTEYMGGAPLVRRNLWSNTHFPGSGGPGTLPTGWTSIGASASNPIAVAQEVVGGNSTGVVKVRRIGATGLEGISCAASLSSGVSYQITALIRVPTGATAVDVYVWDGGTATRLVTGAALNAQQKDVWVSYSVTHTTTAARTTIGLAANDGAAGAGFDLTTPQLELGTVATAYQKITDWTTEYNDDDARRLAIRSRILLWQDSTATVPVTKVEDPVGFIVDTSQRYSRLGSNLITNGTFDTDLSGWIANAAWTWDATGKAKLTGDGSPQDFQQNCLNIGRTYEVAFDVSSTGGDIGFTNTGAHIAFGSSGRVRGRFVATSTSLIFKRVSGTVTGTIDNISVREVITDALPSGRGPEMAPSTNATTGWSGSNASVSSVNGNLRVVASTGTIASGYAAIPVVAERWYEVTGSVAFVSGTADSGLQVRDASTPTTGTLLLNIQPPNGGSATNASGPVRGVFKAAVTGTYYLHCRMGGGVVTVGATNDYTVSVRELPGNHAYQSTTTSRGLLSARVNLLTKTDKSLITNDGGVTWFQSGGTLASGTFTQDGTTALHRFSTASMTLTSGVGYKLRGRVKGNGTRYVYLNAGTNMGVGACIDTQTGTVAAGTAATSISLAADGYVDFLFTGTGTGTAAAIYFQAQQSAVATDQSYAGDSVSQILVDRVSLRTAADSALNIPVYQRVNTSTDYDTVGFPHFIKLDGVDDGYVTNSIDFSGTDKMTVFAGVQKLSDATLTAVLVELSSDYSANNGSFAIFAPGSVAGTYGFRARNNLANAAVNTGTTYTVPHAAVITQITDLANTAVTVTGRVNGSGVVTAGAGSGAGNFGSFAINMGRRAAPSQWLNGRIYGVVIRGAATDSAVLLQLERYIGSLMGIVL